MKNLLFKAVLLIFCASCAGKTKHIDNKIIVSIQPLKYLVEKIVGDDFDVEVLVPSGSSPETYEPTPAQIASVEKAKLVFSTGLIDFERSLLIKASEKESFVNLSDGLDLIEGSCLHEQDGHGAHNHGIDPHIWTAPKALIKMTETIYERIHELWPDSLSYSENYRSLHTRLTELHETVKAKTDASAHRSFLIFHPGLTYYARDYGLRQIAMEQDGKDPSARHLRETIESARADNIRKIMYQSEFPRSIVEVAAAEIGAEAVEIDILGYDVINNILHITDLIVAK